MFLGLHFCLHPIIISVLCHLPSASCVMSSWLQCPLTWTWIPLNANSLSTNHMYWNKAFDYASDYGILTIKWDVS